MRRAEVLMAAGLLAFAVVMLRQALHLPVGWTATGPGAGFFPFWLALGVGVVAVVLLWQAVRMPAAEGALVPVGAWKPLLVVFLPIVAIIALLGVLGLYLGGALYLAGYTRLVGRHRWPFVAAVSVLVPLGLFLIFERWFLLPMPKGAVLEWLLYGR